ncbi:MAG: hypothetical protein KF901_33900, partial [Myxococcales bacterium]|nr:hypothetical protein [Myxococcales bacterium]
DDLARQDEVGLAHRRADEQSMCPPFSAILALKSFANQGIKTAPGGGLAAEGVADARWGARPSAPARVQ